MPTASLADIPATNEDALTSEPPIAVPAADAPLARVAEVASTPVVKRCLATAWRNSSRDALGARSTRRVAANNSSSRGSSSRIAASNLVVPRFVPMQKRDRFAPVAIATEGCSHFHLEPRQLLR